jgi:hypothetical protein
MAQRLCSLGIIVFNPRRDDWNKNLEQSIRCPQFVEQVRWEQKYIKKTDLVLFYFAPDSKSPVTMLELGETINTPNRCVVFCPEGFWRKGNVDLFCIDNNISMVSSFDEMFSYIENMFLSKQEQC